MTEPLTPEDADRGLALHARNWWRAWDAQAIARICSAVPNNALPQWPRVAFWRALSSLMHEGADVLVCLDAAYRGYAAQDDRAACLSVTNSALAVCLIDVGAMDRVEEWLARARRHGDVQPGEEDPWLNHLGTVARCVLAGGGAADAASPAKWLYDQLTPLQDRLSPDERLIAAQVLVNYHLAQEQYEQFDLLATLVEAEATFSAASPLMQARWWYTLGFAQYQIGNHARAEAAWQQALAVARRHRLDCTNLITSLAFMRLFVDKGRIDEARKIEKEIDPRWGGGRNSQLVLLQQMRARLRMIEQQPALAHATLREALALANQAGLPAAEQASCLTDLVQVLIALNRGAEAQAKLEELIREHSGRDESVYRCLLFLLRAWQVRVEDQALGRELLRSGLDLAQQLRYTMFFRLLPALAASICALALTWDIDPVFVREVIRQRSLGAPPQADARWPWPLWIRMIGGFEVRVGGEPLAVPGRMPPKPLELLRMLGCRTSMSIGLLEAAERLWPDADVSARKNIEMTIKRLRVLLRDDSLVLVEENRISLDASRVNSDVRCRRLLVEKLNVLATRIAGHALGVAVPGTEECIPTLAAIRSLGLGHLLPAVGPAGWLEEERHLCQLEAEQAMLAAANVLRHLGSLDAETEILELAVSALPIQERLAARLVEAYARNDRPVDAAREYGRFKSSLKREHIPMSSHSEATFARLLGRTS